MLKYTFYVGVERTGSREQLLDTLSCWLAPKGATIQFGQGLWKGQVEDSATVTILVEGRGDLNPAGLAHALRDDLHQEAVIWTVEEVSAYTTWWNKEPDAMGRPDSPRLLDRSTEAGVSALLERLYGDIYEGNCMTAIGRLESWIGEPRSAQLRAAMAEGEHHAH